MAITKCTECGGVVSDQAKACPTCGAKPRKPASKLGIVFALIVLAVILKAVFSEDPERDARRAKAAAAEAALTPEYRADRKAEQDRASKQIDRAYATIPVLKKTMKNPDSFKLDSALSTPAGALCFEYRGTNTFNAIVPAKAVVAPGATQVATGSDQQVAVAWNKHCANTAGDEIGAVLR
jgi:predicted  nucleic acid-binding Zn-ribbon protein